ncbi:MAG: pentapeptide repeat-containing protein, partial [Akkermansiaceae bacterium]
RARRIASDTLMGCRLDERINQLFQVVRSGERRLATEEVVQVIDGLVARVISRRIWIGIIALMTVLPAAASLVLLSLQNQTMVKKLEAEELVAFQQDRQEFISMLQANEIRAVGSGASRRLQNNPAYHRHVRSAAMMSLIALEKQRWSEDERSALPATRRVDLRVGEYTTLVIGSHLSLGSDEVATDLTRVNLDGSDLNAAKLYNVWLDGSSFRNVRAEGARFWLSSARHTDFSNMHAPKASFAWDALIAEPLHIESSRFNGANLQGASFDQVLMIDCTFEGADLTGAVYNETFFKGCDLTKCKLGAADFTKGFCGLHKCRITSEQKNQIKLPSYCRVEKSPQAGVWVVMSDAKAYQEALKKAAASSE